MSNASETFDNSQSGMLHQLSLFAAEIRALAAQQPEATGPANIPTSPDIFSNVEVATWLGQRIMEARHGA